MAVRVNTPLIYVGSISHQWSNSATATLNLPVTAMRFNCVKLEDIFIYNTTTNTPYDIVGPIYVGIKELKPICWDLIKGEGLPLVDGSFIGGANFNGLTWSSTSEALKPFKMVSNEMQTFKGQLTYQLYDGQGRALTGLSPQILTTVVISFWQTNSPTSTQ